MPDDYGVYADTDTWVVNSTYPKYIITPFKPKKDKRCPNCKKRLEETEVWSQCPYCGFNIGKQMYEPITFPNSVEMIRQVRRMQSRWFSPSSSSE